VVGSEPVQVQVERRGRFQIWAQQVTETAFTVAGLHVPTTELTPMPKFQSGAAILYLDDRGRCAALQTNGIAARLARITDRDREHSHPNVIVPDLPGWGETTPALVPYAMAGRGSNDRIFAYISAALGDPVLAWQVRCAAGIIRSLTNGDSVRTDRLTVTGHGLGGVVALLAAGLTEHTGPVVTWNALASFQLLCESESYAWPAAAFLPDALRYFDLPDIAAALPAREVIVINPLDADRKPLDRDQARNLFADLGPNRTAVAACPDARALELIGRTLVIDT